MTIHKAQGLEVPYAVVDVGQTERANGIKYVGLSCTRLIQHLALTKCYDMKRYQIHFQKI